MPLGIMAYSLLCMFPAKYGVARVAYVQGERARCAGIACVGDGLRCVAFVTGPHRDGSAVDAPT